MQDLAALTVVAMARGSSLWERAGESPMAYLTSWRMALAADRLRGGTDTVARIASSVGYPSPFSFSTAFKRT